MQRGKKRIEVNVGDRFGKLSVLYETDPRIDKRGKDVRQFILLCDCGNITKAALGHLRSGHTNSCGCYQKEQVGKSHLTHGETGTRLYRLWCDIRNRCYNQNVVAYPDYGGRGITVFREWRENYIAFSDYIKTIEGWDDDSLSIDRINNNGNYEPGNVRFVTDTMQARNKRANKNNKTHHRGVTSELMPSGNYRFRASVSDGNKKIQLGSFSNVRDAVEARNNYIISHGLTGYPLQDSNDFTLLGYKEYAEQVLSGKQKPV